MIQMTMFTNNEELLTFDDDDDEESFAQYGDVFEYDKTDLMAFSPESDTLMIANPNAEFEETPKEDLTTWQTFDYDEEKESGAATIFYNFENEED